MQQQGGGAGMGDPFHSLFLLQQAGMMYSGNPTMVSGVPMAISNHHPASVTDPALDSDDAASEIQSCEFMFNNMGYLDDGAMLASVGYNIQTSDLPYLAQRLQRLESLIQPQSSTPSLLGGDGGFCGDFGELCLLSSSESLSHNTTDLVGWVETAIGLLEPTTATTTMTATSAASPTVTTTATPTNFSLPSSDASNFGGIFPNFGGNGSPASGGNAPTVTESCPNIGGIWQNFGGSGPNFGGNDPTATDFILPSNASNIGGNSPNIGGNCSGFEGNCPNIGVGYCSNTGGNCHGVDGNGPKFAGNGPSVVGNCVNIGGNCPTIAGNGSTNIAENGPSIGADCPNIAVNGPIIGGNCFNIRGNCAAGNPVNVGGNFSVVEDFAAYQMNSIADSFQESPSSVMDQMMLMEEKEIKEEEDEDDGKEEEEKKEKKRQKRGPKKEEKKAKKEAKEKKKVEVKEEEEEEQELGVYMVCLLVACAQAVQDQNLLHADTLLKQIRQHLAENLQQQGGAMAKVAAHFSEALAIRVYNRQEEACQNSANFGDYLADFLYCHFYEACPYLKFAHFTANQAILEAFEGHKLVHIIDLNLMQGLQWPSLIQALAFRPEGPPEIIKLTGIGPPRTDGKSSLQEAGNRLSDLAKMVNLNLQFEPVVISTLDEIRPWMVQSSPEEAVAVNSIFHLHKLLQSSGRVNCVLEWIRGLTPAGVTLTMVEQEANHNSPVFYDRFMEALHHYSAMFDSLEASLVKNVKHSQEEDDGEFGGAAGMYLGREICNIVACEGTARVERHEPLSQWRVRMAEQGFEPVAMGYHALEQSSKLVSLFSGEGYTVNQDQGCLTLSWHNRPLIASSAWHSC